MNEAELKRKVKRMFGDEYALIINDQDILDWCNEGQLRIARETSYNDVTVSAVASAFPIDLPQKILVNRVLYKNTPLPFTDRVQLDAYAPNEDVTGEPEFYYVEDQRLYLWRQPPANNTQNVEVTYSSTPDKLTLLAPYLYFDTASPATKLMTVPHSSVMNVQSFSFIIEFTKANWSTAAIVAARATNLTTDQVFTFTVETNGFIKVYLSNGTTTRTATSSVAVGLPNNSSIYLMYSYNAATGIVDFYTSQNRGLTWTQLGASAPTGGAYALKTDTEPLTIGSFSGTPNIPGGYNGLDGFVSYFRLTSGEATILGPGGNTVAEFDGQNDLTQLVSTSTTAVEIKSGQIATLAGTPLVIADNEFSIPEMYQEDLIRFVLARAYEKNRNYRAYELAMSEFSAGIGQRIHENQGEDSFPTVGIDPFDFESYYYYGPENVW